MCSIHINSQYADNMHANKQPVFPTLKCYGFKAKKIQNSFQKKVLQSILYEEQSDGETFKIRHFLQEGC